MKIIVTGADGQLGRSLRRESPNIISDASFVFTDINELDITGRKAVADFFRRESPDIVVNCAAYTNVDRAEDDVERAYLINSEAPAILAEETAACGAGLIHISTDYVFGGNFLNTPADTGTPVAPLGVYGKSKEEGERKVRELNPDHIIIRTAWLYSEYGKNFLLTMLNLLKTKETVNVVYDQTGSPTYAGDLALAILEIIRKGGTSLHCGTYHFSDEGVCSWYDFSKAIAEISGLDSCKVLPCLSEEFPSKVHRPPYSVLSKRKIKEDFGVEVPYWRDSLRKCISNLEEKTEA